MIDRPWLMELLREQQHSQFADLAGTEASLVVPVSDRLLTRLIMSRLPSSVPVRELELHATAGNQIAVRLRLSRPSFLPAFTIRLVIEQQPLLPASPVLVLRIVSGGLAALAGAASRFLQALPPGLRLDGELLHVNLATLLAERGAAEVLAHLTKLELTTTDGRVVVTARAAVPERAGDPQADL